MAQRYASMISQPLSVGHDFDAWRDGARQLLAADVAPDRVIWRCDDQGADDLFAQDGLPAASALATPVQVPREFLNIARSAILHTHPHRHSLLYRILWRLQREPAVLSHAADDDVRQLNLLKRQVARDIHKMRAFVRFREVASDDGGARFVAWFEPQFAILRANAAFFVNRFAQMHWSILTPKGSLHWDGAALLEGPPAQQHEAPADDAAEDLWRKYYAAIFNPARLKIGAMVKEMPRRYWKNLPEAELIPQLIAGAQQREAAMVAIGQSAFPAARPNTLDDLAKGVAACRACPIGCNGTRAVTGEGDRAARFAIIGEQPGDQEERVGRPFIGPAGQLLDVHLQDADIDRRSAWVTNAVKHFKHTPTGRRRLHQTPTAGEIDHCRWWLESEMALIKPQLIIALGASAARGLLGRTVSVNRERGQFLSLNATTQMMVTAHPSYLLRLDGQARDEQEARFRDDLRLAAGHPAVQRLRTVEPADAAMRFSDPG